MPSHRIHLKGPWDYALIPQSPPLTTAHQDQGTVTMPQEWQTLFGQQSGTARFVRRFHRPTNLDPNEQVMIVFSALLGAGHVLLNQISLGEFALRQSSVEFEITNVMKSFNELCVELAFDPKQHPDQPGGLFGAVAIEIRTP